MAAIRHGEAAVLSVLSLAGALFREIAVIAPLSLFCAEAVRLVLSGAWTGDCARWSKAQWLTRARLLILAALPVLAALAGVLLAHRLVVAQGAYPASTLQIIKRNLTLQAFNCCRSSWPSAGDRARADQCSRIGMGASSSPRGAARMPCLALPGAGRGGFHTDRHLYWSFMVILPLIAISLERLFASPPSMARSALLVTLVLPRSSRPGFLSNSDCAVRRKRGLHQAVASVLSLLRCLCSDTTVAHVSAAGINQPQRLILLAEYVLFTVWVYVLCKQGRLFDTYRLSEKDMLKAKGSEAS